MAGDGDGEDQFRFMLSREEFLELFLEDLELPDLAKRRLADLESEGMRRAGYTASGSPANLAILRTMRVALSRRIAMRRPGSGDLNRLAEEIRSLEETGNRPISSTDCGRSWRKGGSATARSRSSIRSICATATTCRLPNPWRRR